MEEKSNQNEQLSGESSQEELFTALQKAQAELQNCRKEMWDGAAQAERSGIFQTVRAIAPVYDALGRATSASDNKAVREGLLNIRSNFEQGLVGLGIIKIETEGRTYDPKYHEVIEQVPSDDEKAAWSIVEEIDSGWMEKETGLVLRAAKVKIIK